MRRLPFAISLYAVDGFVVDALILVQVRPVLVHRVHRVHHLLLPFPGTTTRESRVTFLVVQPCHTHLLYCNLLTLESSQGLSTFTKCIYTFRYQGILHI